MTELTIAPVTSDSIGDLEHALRSLSSEMGDNHLAGVAALRSAFLGARPAFHARLAFNAGNIVGAIVWCAQFSTTRGGGGLYVSDLWVTRSARGQSVGRRLLTAAIAGAEATSGACFLELAVHHSNPAACAYYSHIGFQEEANMMRMKLDGTALKSFVKGGRAVCRSFR